LEAKTISRTAAPASSRIVPVLNPPIPELLSKAEAAVLLAGVVIVTPFGPVYVVVGAMTREPIWVQEFSSEFSSFCQPEPVVVGKPLPDEDEAIGH
jgi:hypothetical protein